MGNLGFDHREEEKCWEKSNAKFTSQYVNLPSTNSVVCKWEHLKEAIFKRKILFSIAKEEIRLKRVIRG